MDMECFEGIRRILETGRVEEQMNAPEDGLKEALLISQDQQNSNTYFLKVRQFYRTYHRELDDRVEQVIGEFREKEAQLKNLVSLKASLEVQILKLN